MHSADRNGAPVAPTPSVDLRHGPLRVSDNDRFLVHEDGTPFFYLGDTAWELFHRLDLQESRTYLEDRALKRLTVIQAVALAEMDGLHEPNAEGERPLIDDDPTRPNEAYFQHVDAVVDMAEGLGLYVGMLPTWGDKWNAKWGTGPVVFTRENAEVYGRFLGERYRDKPVIWILGGDRNPDSENHMVIMRRMARGLSEGDGGQHLRTFHPQGGCSSARWLHEEPWLDFNMLQSGHMAKDMANYRMVRGDYERTPPKPCMDGEPPYEDHAVNWHPANGWFDERDVRKHAYWAVFAGAHGHTYGCHDIWQFVTPEREAVTHARTPWQDALSLPGASQVRHLRTLMESRPFLSRVPDQELIARGQCSGGGHLQATRCSNGSYAMVYVPLAGWGFAVDIGRLCGQDWCAWWYDPRTGEARPTGVHIADGRAEFRSPAEGPDWVLVVDDADRGFPPPGERQGDQPHG
ncbi:MAG: glycoside hydrolase family 140 protein [Candidatus Brocadiia bacterium]